MSGQEAGDIVSESVLRPLVVGAALVLVLFAAGPAGAVGGYGDVSEDRYFAEPVQWSVDNSITGIPIYSVACFLPDRTVTRGDAARWLWAMQDRPEAPAHTFTDMGESAAVSWMVHAGVTTGTSTTTFSPYDPLTRAQIAAFLWRIENEPDAPAHTFNDVHSGWQQGPVSWMSHRNITTGTSATTFSPDAPLTRAHLVTFLWRYQNRPAVTIDPYSPPCRADDAAAFAERICPGSTRIEWGALGCLAFLPPPLEEPYEFVFETVEKPLSPCSGLDWVGQAGVLYVPRDPDASPGQTPAQSVVVHDDAGNVIGDIPDPAYWVRTDCAFRRADWRFIDQFLIVPNDEVDEVVARIWADVADAPPLLPVVYILPEETIWERCGPRAEGCGTANHQWDDRAELSRGGVWLIDRGGHVRLSTLLHELAHVIQQTIESDLPDGCRAFHPETLGTSADGWRDCGHHDGFDCVFDWMRDRYGHGFLPSLEDYEHARTHTTVLTC